MEILIQFGDIDTLKGETIFHLRNLRVAALSATELEVSIIISNNHSNEKCSKKFKTITSGVSLPLCKMKHHKSVEYDFLVKRKALVVKAY